MKTLEPPVGIKRWENTVYSCFCLGANKGAKTPMQGLRRAYAGNTQGICSANAGHTQGLRREYAGPTQGIRSTYAGHMHSLRREYAVYAGHTQRLNRAYAEPVHDSYRTQDT